MWQKLSLLQAHSGPLTGIETGRILANGAGFSGHFHENTIGLFYGVFRDGAGSEKGASGAVLGLNLLRRSYLPGPESVTVGMDPSI